MVRFCRSACLELLLRVRSLHLSELRLHLFIGRGQVHLFGSLLHDLLVDQGAQHVQPQRIGLLLRKLLLLRGFAKLHLITPVHLLSHNRVTIHGSDYIGVVGAVQEVIRIAEEGHLPGIVAHMKALGPASWGLSMALVERIKQARERGVEVYADQYPYDASGTGIVGALIPRWAEVGGRNELLGRIQGADHDRLAADIRRNFERRGGPDKLVISRYAPNPSYEGQSLAQVAKALGKPADETAMDLLLKGDASLVSFNMTEGDIELIMRQTFTMTCTDGDLVPFGQGKPHPRGNGAFARKIHVYVNERGTIDLPFAIRSMTSLPAGVFGLKDRGTLRPGAWADVLIFDPAKVRDAATYLEPHQLSEGMDYVLVNGIIEKDGVAFTGKLGGHVVTPDRR